MASSERPGRPFYNAFGRSHWGLRRTRLGYGFCLGVGRLVQWFCRQTGPKGSRGLGYEAHRAVRFILFFGSWNGVRGERKRGQAH
jgi:hypothetical protein